MKKTNIHLVELIEGLKEKAKKENTNAWLKIADALSKPTRKRKVVNISKINHYSKENDVVLVPGKVLSAGNLNHKVTVVAYQFSQQAKEKINKNGATMTITEFIEKSPKGQMRVLG